MIRKVNVSPGNVYLDFRGSQKKKKKVFYTFLRTSHLSWGTLREVTSEQDSGFVRFGVPVEILQTLSESGLRLSDHRVWRTIRVQRTGVTWHEREKQFSFSSLGLFLNFFLYLTLQWPLSETEMYPLFLSSRLSIFLFPTQTRSTKYGH